jgi:hypothetical protein
MNFVTGFGFTTGCSGGARGMCDFTTAAWCERADRQQLRFDMKKMMLLCLIINILVHGTSVLFYLNFEKRNIFIKYKIRHKCKYYGPN